MQASIDAYSSPGSMHFGCNILLYMEEVQAEAGMGIWVAQGAVGLLLCCSSDHRRQRQADKRQGRQQLFPCYRLTGRETRKAEEMCRQTWGDSASTVLCAQLYSTSACVRVDRSGRIDGLAVHMHALSFLHGVVCICCCCFFFRFSSGSWCVHMHDWSWIIYWQQMHP